MLGLSKVKGFADHNMNVSQESKFVSKGRNYPENVGKGENAGYQHSLLFSQCFQKASFPNKPWFLCVCSTNLLKTLWKKEKLLVTSNFSCSAMFSSLLTHYQMTNFTLFQTERVCRRQFQIWRNGQKVIQTGRNSLWSISPFPAVFSKVLFPRGVKRCHGVGMG